MIFNSVSFAIFLIIVFVLFRIIPAKFKWVVLLASSVYYYVSWGFEYVIWIVIATVVSYLGGILISKYNNELSKKKAVFGISVSVVLGMLLSFKYLSFITDSIVNVFHKFSVSIAIPSIELIAPIGISFYTFQTIAYLFDVYKDKTEPERHFGKYCTFISFFPHVLSGPIPRAGHLLPQINNPSPFDYEQASYGIRQMAWGYFKKLVVSGICSIYVNKIYSDVSSYSGFVLILATVLYAFQIYCDFSGYSDIAIGTAKLFGIDLGPNFRTPYFSQSFKEFWGRWHISLSSWFRDYVYIPLGGSRVKSFRYAFNVFVTMLLSGIWHGASWNFVLWGLLHAVLQVIERFVYKAIGQKKEKVALPVRILKTVIVFVLVCFTWIFFRAETISDSLAVVTNMFNGITSPVSYLLNGISDIGFSTEDIVKLMLSMVLLFVGDYWLFKNDAYKKIGEIKPVLRWIIYIVVLLAIVIFTPDNASNEFIYFNF